MAIPSSFPPKGQEPTQKAGSLSPSLKTLTQKVAQLAQNTSHKKYSPTKHTIKQLTPHEALPFDQLRGG